MPDRRPDRLQALRRSLEEAKLDGILLTSLPNIRYLTGFTGSSALVAVTLSEVLFVTDFRYDTQVRAEVGDFARVDIEGQSLWDGLWRILGEMRPVEIIGFESAHLVHRDFERLLNAGSRWQWRATVNVVETLRETKDPEELALIEEAVGVASRALERAVKEVRVGMTELAIAGALEQALREEGSEGFPFETIVASGPRAALPHARPGSRRLERGDFLLIDFGAIVGGYCSDVTRTFVAGRADAEQREAFEIVRGANEVAASGVRAGMSGRDADALARRYIEDRGRGEEFGHSLGHGIGLEVHEAPRLARTADAVLPAHAVVTIEPGIYRAGWGGIRIEDDVVLDPDGPRVLTRLPRELLEIG
ncbi:MAG TPA: Xaa-Pro peptidase family protein [Gemmatimonadaceae bacterium]|nr:Xaa-Pro peptidase family protein [Gemmatimonadaceae bacterium]